MTICKDAVTQRVLADLRSVALPPAFSTNSAMRGMGGHAKSIAQDLWLPCSESVAIVAVGPQDTDLSQLETLRCDTTSIVVPTTPPTITGGDVASRIKQYICAFSEGCETVSTAGASLSPLDPNSYPYSGIVVFAVAKMSVLHTMQECEAHGLMADYAELWGGPTGQVTKHTARVPRFGEERGGIVSPDELRAFASRWYQGEQRDMTQLKTWTSRALHTWKEILHSHGVDSDNVMAIQRQRTSIVRTLRCLGEPLRWYTSRVADTLHPELEPPPLQRAETPPSNMTREQQVELVVAAVCAEFHDCPKLRTECRRTIQCVPRTNRTVPVDQPPEKPCAGAAPQPRPRDGIGLWEPAQSYKRRRPLAKLKTVAAAHYRDDVLRPNSICIYFDSSSLLVIRAQQTAATTVHSYDSV